MRVIAGSLKGRRLNAPSWEGLRPTSDKLRETLFNILAPRIAGAHVIDGYAGTGALGIEAISRGAAHVVFVERDRRAHELIEENLARCGISEGYAIIRGSAVRAFESLRDRAATRPFDSVVSFDIVLLDPPYDALSERALSAVGDLLRQDGIVVLEHSRRRQAPQRAGRLARTREVTSGDSALTFYDVSR